MRNLRENIRRIIKIELRRLYESQEVDLKLKLLSPGKYPITRADLNYKGDLDLSFAKISSLPDGLKISGDLFLSYSKIVSLPDGLRVRDLFLTGSKISRLPKRLQVRDLNLSDTRIRSLPDGLRVRDLDLSYSNIVSLPDGLRVRNLKLNYSNISSLPKRLQVSGNLDLILTSLADKYDADEIRAMVESTGGYVKGNIWV